MKIKIFNPRFVLRTKSPDLEGSMVIKIEGAFCEIKPCRQRCAASRVEQKL